MFVHKLYEPMRIIYEIKQTRWNVTTRHIHLYKILLYNTCYTFFKDTRTRHGFRNSKATQIIALTS